MSKRGRFSVYLIVARLDLKQNIYNFEHQKVDIINEKLCLFAATIYAGMCLVY